MHRAESHVALGDWTRAWGPSLVALFIAEREFLPGEDRAGSTSSALSSQTSGSARWRPTPQPRSAPGAPNSAAAVRAGRKLVRLAPLRETGYQVLMRALARQGNVAEALVVYAQFCRVLRDELGVSPSAATQAVHETLLHG